MTEFALVKFTDWNALMPEIWLPVPGFRGYDVSNKGRVRSYWRTSGTGRSCVNGQIRGKWTQLIGNVPKLLSLSPDKDGYLTVALRVNGQTKVRRVHRLVCTTFIGEPPSETTVTNHFNNVPWDNRLWNLAWNTISENTLHGNEIGVGMRGEKHGMARLTEKEALYIRQSLSTWSEAKQFAQEKGITPQAVMNVMQRKTWRYI